MKQLTFFFANYESQRVRVVDRESLTVKNTPVIILGVVFVFILIYINYLIFIYFYIYLLIIYYYLY